MSTAVHLMSVFADTFSSLPLEPVPTPVATQPPGMGGINTILNWVKWGAGAICVLSIIAVGAILAMNAIQPGRQNDGLGKLGWTLFGTIVVSGGVSLVTALNA